jgi:adenine/guanine phosphoribosyltransferase-like PRPP-binding protein
VSSITTPTQSKCLFLDPNLMQRLQNRRVLLVDDVVARGTTIAAAQKLLGTVSANPVGAVVAMAQTNAWKTVLADLKLKAVFTSPLLERRSDGWWPIED